MSRILALRRTSTLALRQRKANLLRSCSLPPDLLHASLVERLLKCGKKHCSCHGPFFYLNRSFAKGRFQSLFLKSQDQILQARHGLAAYGHLIEILDEVSQINYELLRRREPLGGSDV
jgi:hypothetical protein